MKTNYFVLFILGWNLMGSGLTLADPRTEKLLGILADLPSFVGVTNQLIIDYLFPEVEMVVPSEVNGAKGVLSVVLPNLGEAHCFPNPPSLNTVPKGSVNYLCVGKPKSDPGNFVDAVSYCEGINLDPKGESARLLTIQEWLFVATFAGGANYDRKFKTPNSWYVYKNNLTLTWPAVLGIEPSSWYWSSTLYSKLEVFHAFRRSSDLVLSLNGRDGHVQKTRWCEPGGVVICGAVVQW